MSMDVDAPISLSERTATAGPATSVPRASDDVAGADLI